jgi:tRNA nucleotidyltransferase (CCA-adding enzyme)
VLSTEGSVRFAALLAGTAEPAIATLCERLRIPNDYRELAQLAARLRQRIGALVALVAPGGLDATGSFDAAGTLALLEAADALRRPERFQLLLSALQGTGELSDAARSVLSGALAAAAAVAVPAGELAQLKGPAIAAAYRAARLQRLQELQSEPRKS